MCLDFLNVRFPFVYIINIIYRFVKNSQDVVQLSLLSAVVCGAIDRVPITQNG